MLVLDKITMARPWMLRVTD